MEPQDLFKQAQQSDRHGTEAKDLYTIQGSYPKGETSRAAVPAGVDG